MNIRVPWLGALVLVAVSLTFAACGGDDDGDDNGQTAGGETTTEQASGEPIPFEGIEDAALEYVREEPNVTDADGDNPCTENASWRAYPASEIRDSAYEGLTAGRELRCRGAGKQAEDYLLWLEFEDETTPQAEARDGFDYKLVGGNTLVTAEGVEDDEELMRHLQSACGCGEVVSEE